ENRVGWAKTDGAKDLRFRAENDSELNRVIIALDLDDDVVAGFLLADQRGEVLRTCHKLIVKADDDVAGANAGLFCCRARDRPGNYTLPSFLIEFDTEERGAGMHVADAGAPDFAVRQPVPGVPVGIDRNVDVGGK